MLNKLIDIQNGRNNSVVPESKYATKPRSQSNSVLKYRNNYKDYISHHSLNNARQKKEDKRIALENTKLIKRIYERNSEYSHKKLEKDFKTNRSAV